MTCRNPTVFVTSQLGDLPWSPWIFQGVSNGFVVVRITSFQYVNERSGTCVFIDEKSGGGIEIIGWEVD